MDKAVKKYFNRGIKEKIWLTGGYTFQTWLLVLEGGQKLVFRTRDDFETSGGRKIIISDVFRREKFFYDNVNKSIGHICPEVYVIDDTREYYDKPYQISEYIEGTPLNLCIGSFDEQERDRIFYNIGETAAKINQIKINEDHPYVAFRQSWEEFMAERLRERLIPFVKEEIIKTDEIEKITDKIRSIKAKETLAFLHLDMRHVNMILSGGKIFILDAENCEFGDPLFEFAVIEMNGCLTPSFLDGYKSVAGDSVNPDDELFYYYKMERQALVLDVFMNEVQNDRAMTQYYLKGFNCLKEKLLR